MKTVIGIGMGLFALLGYVARSGREEHPDFQSDEWRREHRWPDGATAMPMDEQEIEAYWERQSA